MREEGLEEWRGEGYDIHAYYDAKSIPSFTSDAWSCPELGPETRLPLTSRSCTNEESIDERLSRGDHQLEEHEHGIQQQSDRVHVRTFVDELMSMLQVK